MRSAGATLQTTDNTIQVDLPAQTRFLNVMAAVVHEVLMRAQGAVSADMVEHITLAVHEACTNIIVHAYDADHDEAHGRIRAALTLYPDHLVVTLRDTGRPFDPSAMPEPQPGEAQVHGYGLYLMRQVFDEVTYHAQPGGNTWHLVKRWTP